MPFERGAREIADWYLSHPDWQVVDPGLDALMDKLAADFTVSFSITTALRRRRQTPGWPCLPFTAAPEDSPSSRTPATLRSCRAIFRL